MNDKTKQRKQIFFKAAKHCQFGPFSQDYERKQSLESDSVASKGKQSKSIKVT